MNKRKLLSIFIMCSMIITLLAPAASYGASFSDTKGHWAESYIDQAVAHGFVQGYPGGTFIPDKSVTRAEFTTMVNKALGNTATSNITFIDVPSSEWFYNDVSKAFSATYVGGYEDNTFKPNSPISRQEAAVMISRIIPAYGSSGNINTFPDRGSVSDWAYTAFQKVNGKGYMGAYGDGNLHPLDNLTRAQTAKIICDILENENIVKSDPTVRSNRTTLSNTIYSNGVTIHKDLEGGDATIENCVILGHLLVQGGGNATLSNSRVAQTTVEKASDSVRFVVRGESVVSSLTAAKEATIQTSNLTGGLYGSGINNLSTLSSSNIILNGSFPKVSVNGSTAKLKLSSGEITNLTVASNASRSEITVDSGATVKTAEVNAESYFHGQGTISTMTANANGITYEKKPTTINRGSGISEPTQAEPEGEIKFSPANGATKVKPNAKITITFNSKMTLYNGKEITNDNIEDFVSLREKSSTGTKVDFTASINSAKTVITITPDNDLDDDTKYFVILGRNAVKDEDGNGNEAKTISFSTGDDGGLATFSPLDGKTGVAYDVRPTITFSEAIETNDSKTVANSYFDDTVIIFREGSSSGAKVSFTASYNSSGRVLTITPKNDLKDDQKYYLGIASNKIQTVKNGTKISENVTWTVSKNVPTLSKVNTTSTGISVSVTAESNLKGTIYGVLLPKGDKAPTGTQVGSGQNGSGTALAAAARDSKSVDAGKSATLNFTGLTNNTAYTYYVVLKVDNTFSKVETKDVTTSSVKKTPVVDTAISATSVNVGQTLTNSTLSGTFKDPATNASVAGSLVWSNSSTAVNATGSFNWTFTPSNTATYNSVTGTVSVTAIPVAKKTPVVDSALLAAPVDVGQTLASSALYGTFKDPDTNASVAGTLAWSSSSTVVNATGNFSWTFTPNDTVAYNSVTGTVSVTAIPAPDIPEV